MSATEGSRSLLDRIGGPNSVTWPGFGILLVISLLVSLASGSTSSSGALWVGLVVGVCAALAVYAVLVLARKTVLRHVAERPRPWRTLACFAIASFVATIVASMVGGILAAATGSPNTPNAAPTTVIVLLSIVGTLVGAVLVLALAAVVVDAWREYRDLATEVRELDRQLSEIQSTTTAELEQQDARVRAEVEALLLSEIDALGTADGSEAAARLRHAALDVVRPLSHDLGLGSYGLPATDRGEPAFDAGQLVRDATATRLFAPWVSALVILVPVLFAALVSDPGAGAMMLAAVTLVEVGLIASLANVIYAPKAGVASVRARLAWLLASALVIAVVVLVTWLALDTVEGLGIAWGILIWIVPVILLLPAVMAALSGVRERQARTLAALQDDVDWQLARSRELVWVRQTTLVRALHGPVQSAVLAASIRLDTAAKAGALTSATIDEARTSLTDALAGFIASSDEEIDLPEVFARLQDMWSGVSELTLEADPAVLELLAADRVCARAVSDVVTEGCSNAVRHGKATRIAVRIGADDTSRVQVVMSDNGDASTSAGEGLGSRLLDAVAISWDRDVTSGGTKLSVLLPVQAPVG